MAMPYKAFKLAMEIFNWDRLGIDGSTVADSNPVEGKSLIEHGYFTEGELCEVVPDRYAYDPRGFPSAEPEWNEKTGTYQYYSFEERCWVEVPEEDMKTYNLDVDKVLGHLHDLMDLDGEPRAVRGNTLWNLGTFWLGSRKATVYLARRFSKIEVFDEVFDILKRLGGKSPGVVVAWNTPQGRHLELPHGHRMVNLKQAMITEGDDYRVDVEMVKGVLTGGQRPVDDLSPVQYSPDFSLVRVNDKEFVFTGMKQKQAIGILVEAYKRGEPKCRTQVILEDIESSANALGQLFRGRSDWRELIGQGEGFCWLKV